MWLTLLVLLFILKILKKALKIKKKALKMTSQLDIFRAFLFICFVPPDPRSEKKNPVNQLIKNSGLSTSIYTHLLSDHNFESCTKEVALNMCNVANVSFIFTLPQL